MEQKYLIIIIIAILIIASLGFVYFSLGEEKINFNKKIIGEYINLYFTSTNIIFPIKILNMTG